MSVAGAAPAGAANINPAMLVRMSLRIALTSNSACLFGFIKTRREARLVREDADPASVTTTDSLRRRR
jgi:hypothetical protein